MKNLIVLALFICANESAAHIHSVVRGTNGRPHLVKYNSGLVEFVNPSEVEKIKAFEAILSKAPDLHHKILGQQVSQYEPSIVTDSEIQAIFRRMNNFMKRKSECSDRAHVWSWDEFQKTGTKSEKVFLMLTDAYIRRNRYKWWFHVAPMFTTTSGEKIVTDLQFFDKPVTFNEWKNSLVFSKRDCVTDFQFRDYHAGADQSQDCYVKSEPMYYRIPGDIGGRERGRPKTNWNHSEVKASSARAFFTQTNDSNTQMYYTVLRANNFQANGVIPYGMATFVVKDNQLEASISLDDDQPVNHQQFVHLGSRCPTQHDDTNGDGFIDYEEALKVTGPVLMPLDSAPGPAMTFNKKTTLTGMNIQLEGKVVMIHGTTLLPAFPTSLSTYQGLPPHLSLPIVCGVLEKTH